MRNKLIEAKLKIKREAVRESLSGILTTEILDIEDFTLQILSSSIKGDFHQAQIFDQDLNLVLISPELELDQCIKKSKLMANSLGEILKIEPLEGDMEIASFFETKLAD